LGDRRGAYSTAGEGTRDRRRYPDRFIDRELLLAVEPLPKRLALDEGHDVEERAVRRLTGIVQRQEMRVLEMARARASCSRSSGIART